MASARPFRHLDSFLRSCHSCSSLARPTPQNSNSQRPTPLKRAPPTQGTKVPGGGGAGRRGDLPASTDRAREGKRPRQPTNRFLGAFRLWWPGGGAQPRHPPQPLPPQPRTGLRGKRRRLPFSLACCPSFDLLAAWPSSLSGPAPNVYLIFILWSHAFLELKLHSDSCLGPRVVPTKK